MRQIYLDYILFAQSMVGELAKSTRRTSGTIQKEYQKYTPVGDNVPVWNTDLASYTWDSFQVAAINELASVRSRFHFKNLIETEMVLNTIKWQLIISGSRTYGAKKNVYGTSNEDFLEFVEAVQDNVNSKVMIKVCMEDPQLKAKQMEQVCCPSGVY